MREENKKGRSGNNKNCAYGTRMQLWFGNIKIDSRNGLIRPRKCLGIAVDETTVIVQLEYYEMVGSMIIVHTAFRENEYKEITWLETTSAEERK